MGVFIGGSGGGGGGGAPTSAGYVLTAPDSSDLPNSKTLAEVHLVGTLAGRPAASVAGRIYFANDTQTFFRDSGVAWVQINPAFGASGAPHAAGIVPDPGSIAGNTRALFEDGTWKQPTVSGVAGGTPVNQLGQTGAPGVASTFIRTDDIIRAFLDNINPVAVGDVASPGTDNWAMRRDAHIAHGPVTTPGLHVGTPYTVWKYSDSAPVNNSSTLVNDAELFFTAAANSCYFVLFHLVCSANDAGVANVKAQLYGPSGLSGYWGAESAVSNREGFGADTQAGTQPAAFISPLSYTGFGSRVGIWGVALSAVVFTGSTAGTVGLSFAQITPTVADTKLLNGSSMHITKRP